MSRNASSSRTLIWPALMLWSLLFTMSGCRVVKGIFEAGVWVGVIAVALVLGLVGGAIALLKK